MTTSESLENLSYQVSNGVALITLNRPEKLNAITVAMIEGLVSALDAADADDAVRVVVVTGAGRVFSAGADLSAGGDTFDSKAANRGGSSPPYDRKAAARKIIRSYYSLKPVIAAVNGPAMGMAATMTLPMDIRMCSSTAKFGFVFTRRGIVPEAGSTWFLPRIVGISTAIEWSVTGRTVDANEALHRGLVRSVHPPEELMPAALALAAEIASNTAPVSVALARQMMWRALSTEPLDALDVERLAMHARGSARDVREGVSAFLERRAPAFPENVSKDMPDFFPWWD